MKNSGRGAVAHTVDMSKEAVKWSAAQVTRLVWRALSRGAAGLVVGLVLAMATLWLAARFSQVSSLRAGFTFVVAAAGCALMGATWGLRSSLTITVEQIVDRLMGKVQASLDSAPGVSPDRLALTLPQVEERVDGVVDGIRAEGKGNFVTRRVRKLGGFAAEKAGGSLVATCRKAANRDEDGVERVDVMKALEAGALKLAREKAVDAAVGRLNLLLIVLGVLTVGALALPALL